MQLNNPFMYVHRRTTELEDKLSKLKLKLKSEGHNEGSEDIVELEKLLNEYKEAEKAIYHARDIDIIIRETFIYPFSIEQSMKISKRLITFIQAHHRHFIDSNEIDFQKFIDIMNKK